MCSLKDLQDFLRALSGIPGDRTKILPTQNDLAGFVDHGLHPRPPHCHVATQLHDSRLAR